MNGILETLAFTLVIGGQFLAAIVLIARRKAIYFDSVPESADETPAVRPGRMRPA